MRMFNPPHPGEILAELWLEPLKLTITQAAKNLNVTRKTVSALVNGKTAISPEMALRLELVFVCFPQNLRRMHKRLIVRIMAIIPLVILLK